MIKDHNPHFISLQETHIPYQSNIIAPSAFNTYSTNNPCNTTAMGGIGVKVKNSVAHKRIFNSSKFLNIVGEITLNFTFAIISIYIHPNETFDVLKMLIHKFYS